MKANQLKIAIQNSGRLKEDSLKYLQALGLQLGEANHRALILPCRNAAIEILYVRHIDIPQYVQGGAADFGIAGENVIFENDPKVQVVRKLGFGQCSLVIAVPKNSAIKDSKDLEGERIATAYPRSLRKFLKQSRINASVVEIRGSAEISTSLNLADAICDLTQTGNTLRENGLVPIETILKSEAVLIVNPLIDKEQYTYFETFLKDRP